MNDRVRRLTHAYATMFDEAIEDFVEKHDFELQGSSRYLARYGYLVTIIFKRRLNLAFDHSGDAFNGEFKNLDHIYNLMCRRVLGRDYAQHRDQQPLVVAGLDVNGTRHSRHVSQVENVHIHSIWVTSSITQAKFVNALFDFSYLKKLEKFDIQRIDVRRLSNMAVGENGVTRVSNYVAKFPGQNAVWLYLGYDDVRLYPKPKADHKDGSPAACSNSRNDDLEPSSTGDRGRQQTSPSQVTRAVQVTPTSTPASGIVRQADNARSRAKHKLEQERLKKQEQDRMNALIESCMVDIPMAERPPAPKSNPFAKVYVPPPPKMSEKVRRWLREEDRAATERRFSQFFVDETPAETPSRDR